MFILYSYLFSFDLIINFFNIIFSNDISAFASRDWYHIKRKLNLLPEEFIFNNNNNSNDINIKKSDSQNEMNPQMMQMMMMSTMMPLMMMAQSQHPPPK
jgi:hypothetical protein